MDLPHAAGHELHLHAAVLPRAAERLGFQYHGVGQAGLPGPDQPRLSLLHGGRLVLAGGRRRRGRGKYAGQGDDVRIRRRHRGLVHVHDRTFQQQHIAALQDRSLQVPDRHRQRPVGLRHPEYRRKCRTQDEDDGGVDDRPLQRADGCLPAAQRLRPDGDRARRGLPRDQRTRVPRPLRQGLHLQHVRPAVLLRCLHADRGSEVPLQRRHAVSERVRRGRAHGPDRERGLVQHRRRGLRERRCGDLQRLRQRHEPAGQDRLGQGLLGDSHAGHHERVPEGMALLVFQHPDRRHGDDPRQAARSQLLDEP